MRPILLLLAAAAALLSGCRQPPAAVDLLGAGDRLVEARAAGAASASTT